MDKSSHQSEIKALRFSERLKKETRKVHTIAEQSSFIRGFLRGTASYETYLQLLIDLEHVYTAIERELERLFRERVRYVESFYFPQIFRVSALRRDIRVLNSLVDTDQLWGPSEHSRAYAKRVRDVSIYSPTRLVGHLYTRYLGDLSGGQILARIARNSMGLRVGRGLDFYEFEGIECIDSMKRKFRDTLDLLDALSEQKRAAVCDEAVKAFRYNIEIFQALEGNTMVSLFRNLPFIRTRQIAV